MIGKWAGIGEIDMDAKEFLLKAIRLCENHDCHECPLDGGEEDKCLLDHFGYVHIDHDKLIASIDNLVDEVEECQAECDRLNKGAHE